MSSFIKSVGMERSELLGMLVENYLFARENHTNTLLGEPREVTQTQGILDGACMVLGVNYRVEGDKYKFFTNVKEKMICEVSMGEYYELEIRRKKCEAEEMREFKKSQ